MSIALGIFRADDAPEYVRSCLAMYFRMLDACRLLRAQHQAAGEPLLARLQLAAVQEDVEAAIARATGWLRRAARRGGRGVAPVPRPTPADSLEFLRQLADVFELQAQPEASMAHGCAAVASAVGPAPALLPDGGVAVPADLLFSGPVRQDLPSPGTINDAGDHEGGQFDG